MIEIRRGDIWLVNLDPTIGYEIRKARPAVIIQNEQELSMKQEAITSTGVRL